MEGGSYPELPTLKSALRAVVGAVFALAAELAPFPRVWAVPPCGTFPGGPPGAQADLSLTGDLFADHAVVRVTNGGTGAQGACPSPSVPPTPDSRQLTARPVSRPAPPPVLCTMRLLDAAETASWQADAALLGPGQRVPIQADGVVGPIPFVPIPSGAPAGSLFFEDCRGPAFTETLLVVPPTPGAAKPAGPSQPPTPPTLTTYQIAEQVLAPGIAPAMNPGPFGITGLESYFWLGGYDGRPIDVVTGTASTGLVELHAAPSHYVWDFGDGVTMTTTGLGAAYPAVSDIRHTYDIRSDRSPLANPDGTYTVSVTAFFDASFRAVVPGADLGASGFTTFASRGFPQIQSTGRQHYKVIEVVSRLTG